MTENIHQAQWLFSQHHRVYSCKFFIPQIKTSIYYYLQSHKLYDASCILYYSLQFLYLYDARSIRLISQVVFLAFFKFHSSIKISFIIFNCWYLIQFRAAVQQHGICSYRSLGSIYNEAKYMRWVELFQLEREMSLITFGYRVDYISYHGVVTADTRGATKYL